MNSENQFSYLSAAAVKRLSHEQRLEYYRNMLEFNSESEQSMLEDDDENDDDYLPGEQNIDSDCEDVEEDVPVELNSDSDGDDEGDDANECDDQAGSLNGNFFTSKDGVKWYKDPPSLHRQRAQNIIRNSCMMGPLPMTKNLSKVETFKCIMSPAIMDIICRHSNGKAEATYAEWNAANPGKARVWKKLTDEELTAFLGILIITGCHISNHETIPDLWKKNSYPLYRATMGKNRFKDILRFIRFDSNRTRATRLQSEKDAPIKDIFDMLNSNLKAHYRPHESITVDEQLLAFRGRTRFTQYMPSKPAKYGIKIWWASDSATFYPLNGQIYTGKTDNVRDVNQGERVVKDLVSPYKGTGRNVTMDNFFTTLPLAEEMLSWKLSIVGTLKKNKRYLPQEFKPSKTRDVGSSLFGFSQNVTMVSYVPAKNKAVVLLSTIHRDKAITGPKEKPEIIMYYNKTKGGVDTMDKMLSQYTCKRGTRRWPLAMFYNLVDTAALAAYIICMENNPEGSIKMSRRKQFLEQLGEDLCIQHIKSRSVIPRVAGRFSTRSAIECILGESISGDMDEEFIADEIPERDVTGRIKQKGKCYMCREEKKLRNTRQSCITCKKPVCLEHSYTQTKCENCHMGTPSSFRNLR